MKKLNLFAIALMLLGFVLSSCDEDDKTTNIVDNSIVKQFTSSTGGSLKADNGIEIIVPNGAIRKTDDGSDGTISFSIEPTITDLPKPIPSTYTLVGSVCKLGPANFTFTEPILIYLPGGSLSSPANAAILQYSELNGTWTEVPIFDIDATGKRLGAACFELGYFALVTKPASNAKTNILELHKSGGIKMVHSGINEYYYTLLVASFTPKYSEDSGTNMVGSSSSTGSYPTGGPLSTTYMGGIPQGDYGIIVSRVRRGTMSSPPGERQYYSVIVPVSVGGFSSTLSWDWYNWSGWTEMSFPAGEWTTSAPSQWPAGTKPYGTGQFQATLSWVNNSTSSTDLDLHVYGPNNLHVCYWLDRSSDGAVELDLDWMSSYGNATENIYSLKSMTRGEYSVYVNLYSGDQPKTFEVRVIRQGSTVKTYRGTATTYNSGSDQSKMILITRFTI